MDGNLQKLKATDKNREKRTETDKKQTEMDRSGQKRTETNRKRQKLIETETNRQRQTETDRNGQKRTETDRNGQKRTETERNRHKWTKADIIQSIFLMSTNHIMKPEAEYEVYSQSSTIQTMKKTVKPIPVQCVAAVIRRSSQMLMLAFSPLFTTGRRHSNSHGLSGQHQGLK